MTGAADWAGQGRGFLARLFAVVAVVAALMVVLVPLCGDGMLAGMPMAPVVASTGDTAPGPRHGVQTLLPMSGPCLTVTGSPAQHCPSVVDAAVGAAVPDRPGGALLATCLAIVAAVLVMAFGLGRPQPNRAGVESSASPRWPVVFGCPARRPSLAELCVLRT